jgi:integrase/recombinase XerD
MSMTFTPSTQPKHIAVERWAREMRDLCRSPRTVEERAQIVYRFGRLAETDPVALTAEDIFAVLDGLDVSPSTVQTYLGALHAWFVWCERAGLRDGDPTLRVGRPQVPERQPRPIADAHALVLSRDTTMRPATRAKIVLGMYAGLRVSEIARIKGQDVDLIASTLIVAGKGGRVVTLPLHPLIAEVAREMPGRGWWFPSPADASRAIARTSCSDGIRRAMHRLGIPGSGHQLRHWFASSLLEHGVDVRVVQTLMRHSSLATTAIYTRVSAGMQREALDHLPTFEWDLSHVA